MEEQIAALAAELAAVKDATAGLNRTAAETFYYVTIPLMVLIHAGFLSYEMGASRAKNALASGIKNILAFAFIIPTFYYAGWFIYWAFPTGFSTSPGPAGISGWDYAVGAASPVGSVMGPSVADSATGVFFGAFAMFAATTASIMSGSLIERIQIVGFTILAIVLGSFVWILGAAWGWHADGWLVTSLGYHDFGASGVVHAIAGFFTLGVLINLGARVGKFNPDGTANSIPGHSLPATLVGLMLIIAGFWGFLMACVIFPGEPWSWGTGIFATIYGTPVTLSAMTFNILMGFAGGAIAAWVMTHDPFWMMSGALGGIISVAAGLDLYWPPMAFVIAAIGGVIMPLASRYVERRRIDDAVGAVALHGVVGVWGVLAVGIFASGYPALTSDGAPVITLVGQLGGAVVMVLLGFVPGYAVSLLLKRFGLLRVPKEAELLGLDKVKVPAVAYPEILGEPARGPVTPAQ
ncbi:ammonium transporter [Rhodobacter calidifons]|uniref:Ammonium transporter n=1 Tax=Rhodobacter calidifons TaxID=2715277 RepID=A0ABX0G5V5_9RHOB|nr:ammonium transporter [Rhodobacter calidifons]NHB76229.1 ammonium transporter [Rhodobacter calidifons]